MNNKELEILIKQGGFDFKSQGKTLFSLSIPTNILNDMEVLDPLGFEKLVNESIKKNNIKPEKIVIYLSNEVIFNKIVASEDEKIKFFEQIPLEPEKLIKETINSGKEMIAVAVNKKFINDIKLILEKIGFRIISIVPETESLQKNIDFNKNLEGKTTETKGNANEKTPKGFKIALVLFMIMAIVALLLFFFIKKPSVKSDQVNQTPQPSPTATPITFLNKDEIKIQILNKTKTAGLAKKAMEALSDFSNIETGNTEGNGTQTTDITFSSKVGQSEREEINNILSDIFTEVATKEAELNDGFDILIETGNPS